MRARAYSCSFEQREHFGAQRLLVFEQRGCVDAQWLLWLRGIWLRFFQLGFLKRGAPALRVLRATHGFVQ